MSSALTVTGLLFAPCSAYFGKKPNNQTQPSPDSRETILLGNRVQDGRNVIEKSKHTGNAKRVIDPQSSLVVLHDSG